MSGEVPGLQGRGHRSLTTYRAYLCGDGIEIVVAANSEKMWENLCAVVGIPDLPKDPRFCNRHDRLKNRAALDELMEAAFAKLPSDAVLEQLRKFEVPAAPINSLDRVFDDPQVKHRDMALYLDDGEGGGVRVAGNPVKIEGSPSPARFPSHLGADSASVLQDMLGLSVEETRDLVDSGIIGAPKAA
jgi:crotonobetainyl-CoA:carnitine CoA-transferase CaiB-like acyl-CoA transferase